MSRPEAEVDVPEPVVEEGACEDPDEGGEEDRGDGLAWPEAQQEEDGGDGEAISHAEADIGEHRDEGDEQADGENWEGCNYRSTMPEELAEYISLNKSKSIFDKSSRDAR